MVSSDDHCQEVVGLCREKTYAGLVGCSGEYLVFQPPRYFSSSQLKLTYRVSKAFFSIVCLNLHKTGKTTAVYISGSFSAISFLDS